LQASNLKRHFALLGAACFAMVWVIARAGLQSVTLDEAASYLTFAAPDWPAYWYASSGNHVLNTILERIFTTVFGLSHLTLRAPALIGAAIYIAASYGLCRHISSQNAIRWPLFLCLVYNPFVMDYMAAARGYGLALGLMMAAIWAAWESRFVTASICLGLSFSANFSFAYIDAAVILVFTVWALRQTKSWRTLARALGPGALTAFLICGSTVWTWPNGQIYYGAAHLTEMWNSIVSSTFDELNPFLVHPLLAAILQAVGRGLPSLVVAVLIWQTLRIVWTGQQLGLILARAVAIAFLCHWLAFRLLRIPLPMERTAIFFVPLALLLIGIGAALPSASRFGAVSRFASIAVLSLCAIYFLGCLRVSYFREWKFDADVKDVYGVLQDLHNRSDIREIEVDWRYAYPLNFYRQYFHDQRLASFTWTEPHVEGKPAYVLHLPEAEDFIRKQNLQVIYRGKVSDAVVAVRPVDQRTTVPQ
jgi:hypothetical protein